MFIAVFEPSTVLRSAPIGDGESTGVCSRLALMAPYWGFFVPFTLYLQERC